MKLLSILFSTYILALSTLFCTDVDDVHSKRTSDEVSTAHPLNQHEDETCSPFCICSCCGTLAVHFSEKIPVKPEEFIFGNYFPAQESTVINISFSVWQPPKIA